MIPLLMQKGYRANGWLGLILGTRLYYSFYDAELDDDAVFEQRVLSVELPLALLELERGLLGSQLDLLALDVALLLLHKKFERQVGQGLLRG